MLDSEIGRKAKRALWIIQRATPATFSALKRFAPTVWESMLKDLKTFGKLTRA